MDRALTRRWLLLGVTLAGLFGGCGGKSEPFPYFDVTATASWPPSFASPALLGYWVDVIITKVMDDTGDCANIPGSVHVLVNGSEATFSAQPSVSCLQAKLHLGPFLASTPVNVLLERNGETAGTASFDGLMPGIGAALTTPADGLVHAGDDLLIRPVPEVPANAPVAFYYPIDEPIWSGGSYAPTDRRLDGVHVQAPAFAGHAWLIVTDGAIVVAATSCAGFAVCMGHGAAALGPFLLTEVP